MTLFAEIVFKLPMDMSFTYVVPEDMVSLAKPGVRVVAPFRNKKLVGYLLNVTNHCSYPSPKKIVEILDPEISIPDTILKLGRWIANYYICGIGEAIDAALPPWKDIKHVRYLTLTDSGKARLEKEACQTTERELLECLQESGRIERQKLEQRFKEGDITPLINTIIKKGFIRSEEKILSKKIRKKKHNDKSLPIADKKFALTQFQKMALETICPNIGTEKKLTFLLHGVTGSGKTEVYLQSSEEALRKGKNVILLVPEIALTLRVVEQFVCRFGDSVALLHSGLTSVEKYSEWKRIRKGEAQIAIGARSAVFAPFQNLGLIIVDEEHDSSYKQDEAPRYNARDVAVVRGTKEKAIVLLGSATPSLESYYNSQKGKYQTLALPERIDAKPMPQGKIVDLKKRGAGVTFSPDLKQMIAGRLKQKEQVLLFLNRRGTSPFIHCLECGNVWKCVNCDISLTYHKNTESAICHYCGFEQKTPVNCPICQSEKIGFKGLGTQKLEDETRFLFPDVEVARLDRDTTSKKGAMEKILKGVKTGKIDILIGTQMISKGHDYPNITLVGVISADSILNIPDFRSSEKTFQQIAQVSGRGGRGKKGGLVITQTYTPEHYSITCAMENRFEDFYKLELLFRKDLCYPPYSRMICLRIEGGAEYKVEKETMRLNSILQRVLVKEKSIDKLGPAKAVNYKIKNRFRWQIVIKGTNIQKVHFFVREGLKLWEKVKHAGVRVIIDVDPVNML